MKNLKLSNVKVFFPKLLEAKVETVIFVEPQIKKSVQWIISEIGY